MDKKKGSKPPVMELGTFQPSSRVVICIFCGILSHGPWRLDDFVGYSQWLWKPPYSWGLPIYTWECIWIDLGSLGFDPATERPVSCGINQELSASVRFKWEFMGIYGNLWEIVELLDAMDLSIWVQQHQRELMPHLAESSAAETSAATVVLDHRRGHRKPEVE